MDKEHAESLASQRSPSGADTLGCRGLEYAKCCGDRGFSIGFMGVVGDCARGEFERINRQVPTIPDEGSSTQKWPRLKAASDAQQGVGSNKAGTVGRAPPWMASIPCKVPGLNLVDNEETLEGLNWN